MKTEKAGCILLNKEKDKIALVYREKQKDYSFPKGHLEGNESLIECAIRETREETKREPIIIKKEPIYIEEYNTPSGEDVRMYYYFAIDNGVSDNDSTDTHDTYWIDLDEVYDKLSYDSLKLVWNSVKEEVLNYIKGE